MSEADLGTALGRKDLDLCLAAFWGRSVTNMSVDGISPYSVLPAVGAESEEETPTCVERLI
jgi:hypothetical protein